MPDAGPTLPDVIADPAASEAEKLTAFAGAGRALGLVVNKWDAVVGEQHDRTRVARSIEAIAGSSQAITSPLRTACPTSGIPRGPGASRPGCDGCTWPRWFGSGSTLPWSVSVWVTSRSVAAP